MIVRLIQLDGRLPNLALMKLAHWHQERGDEVFFSRRIEPDMFEPAPDRVYGSAIFKFSSNRMRAFREEWPEGILGGTGTDQNRTVEDIIGQEYEHYDYSLYPNYAWSLGFTQRGCRLKCKFCVVPAKEGKPRSVNSIWDIWREGTERNIHLLDNDFFGQDLWRERVAEIREGGFKVCLNQGINIRLINDEAAEALAGIKYYDDQFKTRRLYTAWDNLKDEKVFSRGIDTLERYGVPASHIMAYMLVGFDPAETWERIFHRFYAMVDRGIRPYPMVYDLDRLDLRRFQRWAIQRQYLYCDFGDFDEAGYNRGRFDKAQDELPLAG